MAILGSVIIFGLGGIAYIDALFFACGSVTQSGLNTLNINDMNTGQQLILYLLAMVCNPIVIHSAVVFVRLYWFEKRFQHIVRDTKTLRRTRSRSRTNTVAREEGRDIPRAEMGVSGRDIKVIRNDVSGTGKDDTAKNGNSLTSSSNERNSDNSEVHEPNSSRSATIPRDGEEGVRLPPQMSPDQHIAFLENQRHPKDSTTLRIPSPREYDQGGQPEALDEDQPNNTTSSPIDGPQFQNIDDVVGQNNPMRRGITIDEPNITRNRERTNAFPRVGSRTATDDVAPDFSQTGLKKRRSTLSNLVRSSTTQEKDINPMPYLSYQPTIGRNSMFVGLTEEQRDELGGIEYRALKTLAIVLVTYFWAFHLLGVVCLVPWIYRTHWGSVVEQDGQGRVWWGFFTSASAFNDLGYTLTPDSMESFYNAAFPLLLMTFLIVIGNTGFPCMLRFVIWAMTKMVPQGSGIWEELQFLLDHPRRCFTLLFPRDATWWLTVVLIVLNGLDLIFFIILDVSHSITARTPHPDNLLAFRSGRHFYPKRLSCH